MRDTSFGGEKYGSVSKCQYFKYEVCKYANAHLTHTKGNLKRTNPEPNGSLENNYICPGSGVPVDHFESRLKGRTYTSFGKNTSEKYVGGLIFVEAVSLYICVEHQLEFFGAEIICAKQHFEKLALEHGINVEDYLADNRIFKANQILQLCGVNAHHKNYFAEMRCI